MPNIMHSTQLYGALMTIGLMVMLMQPGISEAATDKSKHPPKKGQSFGAVTTEYPTWFHDGFLELKEDLATAKVAGKQLVILFTQEGCPYCNALVERNLAQQDIETLMRANFYVDAMNIVGDRPVNALDGKNYTEKSFSEAMKVQFTPTLIFFNEQGEVILRLNGYMPPEQFKIALHYLVEKKDKLSFRDYLELNSPPPKVGKLHAEVFFQSPPYKLTRNSGVKGKPIAVFFEQKDCPNCDTLHQKVLTDPDTRGMLKKYQAVQLDMWGQIPVITPDGKSITAREWAKQLDIKYAPTIMLFNDEGREVIRSEAFLKVFHTQSIFDYVLSGAYKQQPNFQRFISARSEHMRAQGKDVDIWSMAEEKPAAIK
jgi:thioredoxin-related protein